MLELVETALLFLSLRKEKRECLKRMSTTFFDPTSLQVFCMLRSVVSIAAGILAILSMLGIGYVLGEGIDAMILRTRFSTFQNLILGASITIKQVGH